MEKQIKVIICSEDGEWGRGPIQKLAQKGAQALFAPRTASGFWRSSGRRSPRSFSWNCSCLDWTPSG